MMLCGLDVLRAEGFARLAGKRVALLTHPAALSCTPRPIASALQLLCAERSFELRIVFGPEHGLKGTAQDLIAVTDDAPQAGVPVVSLYGETVASLKPIPAMLAGLDMLVIDLVDVGSRYYTFHATMLYCLEACAAAGVAVMILDRPNPLGRTVEGPTIQPGFESFVGPHPMPIRHGLTMGELARLYQAERVPTVNLEVVKFEGSPSTEPWLISPSPNMPTAATALAYPGVCLIEGTNLSEGRGTTRPFEFIGFPGTPMPELLQRLHTDAPPGVELLPATFQPTFQKHAGVPCDGVFLVPGVGFQPVQTGYHLLRAFRHTLGTHFRWRTERYEFIDAIPAIDILFGSDRERRLIDADEPCPTAAWERDEAAFRERRETFLLYP